MQQVRGHRVQQPAGQRAHAAQPLRPTRWSVATTPPITSPWPPRYFVALCSTSVAPCRAGCCRTGVANVLSTSTGTSPGSGDDLGEVEELERGVRGRLDDHEPGVRPDRGGDAVDGRPGHGRAEQAALQHVVGSAVQRTNRDDVRLAVGDRRDQARGERGHAARERHGALGALEVGERILEPRHTRLPQALVDGAAAAARGRDRSRAPHTRDRRCRRRAAGTSSRSRSAGRAHRSRGALPFRRARRGSRIGDACCPSLENSRNSPRTAIEPEGCRSRRYR